MPTARGQTQATAQVGGSVGDVTLKARFMAQAVRQDLVFTLSKSRTKDSHTGFGHPDGRGALMHASRRKVL